jgi:hypothetical protein
MDSYIVQSIEADLTDLHDRILYAEKTMEDICEKLVKQEEIINILIEKTKNCLYN